MEHRDNEQERQQDDGSIGKQAPLNEAAKHSAAMRGAAASNAELANDEAAPGPPDALPAWRPFYAAVRDAARRLRDS